MPEITTNPEQLSALVSEISEGKLQLPEFQRDFVWKPRQIESLLSSISSDYPTGSLLFLKFTKGLLAIREVAAGRTNNKNPFRLILDGQQRLTGLYQVFSGKGENRYYVKIDEALDFENMVLKDSGPDDIINHVTNKKWNRSYATPEIQYEKKLLPLDVFIDSTQFGTWKRGFIKHWEHDWDPCDRLFGDFDLKYGNIIRNYRYPVISIEEPHNTDIEAICRIFETINSTGTKLTVFDLMTASLFPIGVKLRDLWDDTQNKYPYFREDDFNIDPVIILQIITLKRKKATRRNHILGLKPTHSSAKWVRDFEKDWYDAAQHLNKGLVFLINECGVLKKKWLPYEAMLPTLALIRGQIDKLRGANKANGISKLKTWYWCSVFNRRYDKATDTQNEIDYRDLTTWIFNEGEKPKAVTSFTTFEENLERIIKTGDSIFRGVISMILTNKPFDFYSGELINRDLISAYQLDNHHLFPKKSETVINSTYAGKWVDSILNRALISQETDKQIGNKNPSVYFSEIEERVGTDKFRKILSSQLIPPSAIKGLKSDDIKIFYTERSKKIKELIKKTTAY